MHRSRSLFTLLIAAASLAIAGAAHAAQDPQVVADRFMMQLGVMKGVAHTQMVRICEATVRSVTRLDERNAPESRIEIIGNAGLSRIDTLDTTRSRAISAACERCRRTLQRLSASAELLGAIDTWETDSLAELDTYVTEAKAPIQTALETALAG